jgi:hypothetical protein
MIAQPFQIKTLGVGKDQRCEIWNSQTGVCVKHFDGRTAKRRASSWLEALMVGFFTGNSNAKFINENGSAECEPRGSDWVDEADAVHGMRRFDHCSGAE